VLVGRVRQDLRFRDFNWIGRLKLTKGTQLVRVQYSSAPQKSRDSMDEGYLRSLAALKDTFLNGNESQVLAEAILEHHSNQQLTLLDVGTGTGRSLIEIVGRLRNAGLSVNATAVDIFLSSDAADRLKAHDIALLLHYWQSHFAAWPTASSSGPWLTFGPLLKSILTVSYQSQLHCTC